MGYCNCFHSFLALFFLLFWGAFFFVSFLGKVMASARLVFHGIPKMQS